jgi:hypothetical protein
MWSVIVSERTLSTTCLFAHLGVHEAERHAHGDGEQPDEDDLEHDPSPGLVASEAHGVAQAEEAVHADGAQVHDGGGAEQHVEAHPCQAVLARQREEACRPKSHKIKTNLCDIEIVAGGMKESAQAQRSIASGVALFIITLVTEVMRPQMCVCARLSLNDPKYSHTREPISTHASTPSSSAATASGNLRPIKKRIDLLGNPTRSPICALITKNGADLEGERSKVKKMGTNL